MACACKAGKKSGQATAVKQVVKTNALSANKQSAKKATKKIVVRRSFY